MHPHDYFKQLAVLQGSGSLTVDQSYELDGHLRGCAECRVLADECDTVVLLLLQAAEAAEPTTFPNDQRYVLRSQRSSSQLMHGVRATTKRPSFLKLMFAASALLILVAGSFFVGKQAGRESRNSQPTVSRAQNSTRIENAPAALADRVNPSDQLRSTIAKLESKTQELRALQQNYDQILQGRQTLQNRVSELAPENEQLKAELASAQNELQAAKAESSDLQRKEQADHVAVDLAEAEVVRLQQSETKLRQQLEESKRVQALLTDAQKLMEDPNLHTLYVDENIRGKERRGRIFYSEGQYCKFYAWNLGDPATTRDATFYLWGENQEGTQKKIINLGQFQLANAAARRWVLNVDPHAISHVTSVFVTREKTATAQPTGEKMLSREITPLYGGW